MSKKLIIIVVSLFIVQFGIFSFIEVEVKPKEITSKEIKDFRNTYGIYLDDEGQPYESTIYLSNYNLSEIPEKVYSFENMREIDLSDNQLTEFPYRLLALPNLKVIKINDNQIKSIDFSAIEVSNIKVLELKNNELSDLDGLENLTQLSTVNLSRNELYQLPNLTSEALYNVNLSFNRILKLEGKISKNLNDLNLTGNEISEVNLEITGEELLSVLTLKQNKALRTFPDNLLYLPALEELDLSDCSIAAVQESPLTLLNGSLERLYLGENRLFEFELSNVDLPYLKELDLSDNQLTKVNITHHNIEGLLLSSNRLTTENLVLKMDNLSELSLTNNSLNTLTKRSVDAPNLLYLNLFDNPMTAEEMKKSEARLFDK